MSLPLRVACWPAVQAQPKQAPGPAIIPRRYFRACFAGAGASMKGAAGSDAGGQTVVQVPDAAMRDVQTVIASIYEGSIQVQKTLAFALQRLSQPSVRCQQPFSSSVRP